MYTLYSHSVRMVVWRAGECVGYGAIDVGCYDKQQIFFNEAIRIG